MPALIKMLYRLIKLKINHKGGKIENKINRKGDIHDDYGDS